MLILLLIIGIIIQNYNLYKEVKNYANKNNIQFNIIIFFFCMGKYTDLIKATFKDVVARAEANNVAVSAKIKIDELKSINLNGYSFMLILFLLFLIFSFFFQKNMTLDTIINHAPLIFGASVLIALIILIAAFLMGVMKATWLFYRIYSLNNKVRKAEAK